MLRIPKMGTIVHAVKIRNQLCKEVDTEKPINSIHNMAKYTFLDLCKEVLTSTKVPMSAEEIWQKAEEAGLSVKIGTKGKTPSATIAAQLYTHIKNNDDNSDFVQVSKRPARFSLRNNNNREIEAESEIKTTSSDQYDERDLHPLLVKFVYANQHFKCYTKTIYHEKSCKKEKGANRWLHPDLVGVYFPFDDYIIDTRNLQKSLNVSPVKLFSFEMKKELNYTSLREYFFQAVSNSSWANEGYLVALKIDESSEFRNEIQRLSNSFGIGIIQLNAKHIEESEIICPALYREVIDWDTLNRLAEDSPGFKSFISDIEDHLKIEKVKKTDYDEILDDEKFESYVTKKKII